MAAQGWKAAEQGSIAGSNSSAGLEESIWLCPIEDRHKLDSSRHGMLEGFSFGSYLLLVDYTGRLFRDGDSRRPTLKVVRSRGRPGTTNLTGATDRKPLPPYFGQGALLGARPTGITMRTGASVPMLEP
jgi:hypothetical protein